MKFKLSVIIISLFTLFSCEKDKTTTSTQVKTQEELLTAKVWNLDEMRIVRSNGTTDYYKRGGNTFNGNSDSLKFNLNNTGVFYDFLGATYTTTWNFSNSEKTKMTLVINKPSSLTVMIENIALTETYFSYSEYATVPIYYLASSRRIPN